MPDILFVDFETKSECDLKTSGSHKYAQHPSTDAICLGFAFDNDPPELWTPDQEKFEQEIFHETVLKEVERGITVVAHNAFGFEVPIWNEAMTRRYSWPKLNPRQVRCTMNMAFAMSLPASLDRLAGALGCTIVKDMAGNRIMLQLSQPRSFAPDGSPIWWDKKEVPEKFQRVYDYCLTDIVVQREVYSKLMQLSDDEFEVLQMDYEINSRGIQIDLPAVKAAIQIVELEQARLNAEMVEVTQGNVALCTAVAQLKKWVTAMGVPCDGVSKPAIQDILARPNVPEAVRQALLLRQEAAKSSTAKLEAMLLRACDDGRIRGTTQYHGASTGRWSGRGVQVQNLPREMFSRKEIDEVFELLGRIQ